MTGSRHAWAAAFVARAALVGAAYVIVAPFLRVHRLAAVVVTNVIVLAIALPVAVLSVAPGDDVVLANRTLRAWSEVPPDLPRWMGGAMLLRALTALLPFGRSWAGSVRARAVEGDPPASRGAASW